MYNTLTSTCICDLHFSEMNNYLVPENTVIKADTLQHAIDFEGRAVYNG